MNTQFSYSKTAALAIIEPLHNEVKKLYVARQRVVTESNERSMVMLQERLTKNREEYNAEVEKRKKEEEEYNVKKDSDNKKSKKEYIEEYGQAIKDYNNLSFMIRLITNRPRECDYITRSFEKYGFGKEGEHTNNVNMFPQFNWPIYRYECLTPTMATNQHEECYAVLNNIMNALQTDVDTIHISSSDMNQIEHAKKLCDPNTIWPETVNITWQ